MPPRLQRGKYKGSRGGVGLKERKGNEMAIPDFQSIMLSLVRHCGDGQEHTTSDTVEALAAEFSLSEAERKTLLPSGVQGVFVNRVAWAKSHLKMAGLLASPRRGVFKITPRGLEVLQKKPSSINLRFLHQFPEYVQYRSIQKTKTELQDESESNHWFFRVFRVKGDWI